MLLNILGRQRGVKIFRCLRTFSNQYNIVKSPAADLKIPNFTLHEFLWSGSDKWRDKIAVECAETKKKFTYSDVHKRSHALAGFLQRYGLVKGDTIAIVLPNVPEYMIVVLGVLQSGVTVTPVNPVYTADAIRRQIIMTKSKMVFTLSSLYTPVKDAIEGIPEAKPAIVTIKTNQMEPSPDGSLQFDEICSKDYDFKDPGVTADDIALIPFSSGTTGLPKGVVLTHRNVIVNCLQTNAKEFKLNMDTDNSHQDVVPVILPMFHMFGLSIISLTMFSRGAKLVTVQKFDTKAFYNVLHNYEAMLLYIVPPIVLMLLNNPELKLEDLTKLRTVISGAAPLGAADVDRFREQTREKINFLQLYGLTEVNAMCLQQSIALDNGIKIGGSGFNLPSTLCKIVSLGDPTYAPLGPNQSGELLCKGPQVMQGYLNNVEANHETFTLDGWLKTGDIAHYDEHNHFFITDRLKEMIKVSAYSVAPAELEELLRDHPDITDAAVIGIPAPRTGEAPKAFVVLVPNAKTTADDIQNYMSTKVAKYKQLAGGIEFIDKLPRNPSGKILRRLLRDKK